MKKKIRIAIIDSGIDNKIANLNKNIIYSAEYRIIENGNIVEKESANVTHPHGTAIALIIRQIMSNVEFISINILNERLLSDGRILIKAIERLHWHKPDIIHMSLGTTKVRYKLKLQSIVNRYLKSNIAIVASCNNNLLSKAYPANLKGVVKVKGSMKLCNAEQFYYYRNYFYAPYESENIPEINLLNINGVGGNSTAAAYITGHLARYIYNNGLQSNSILKLITNFKKKYSMSTTNYETTVVSG
jgi:hypothetical protein